MRHFHGDAGPAARSGWRNLSEFSNVVHSQEQMQRVLRSGAGLHRRMPVMDNLTDHAIFLNLKQGRMPSIGIL